MDIETPATNTFDSLFDAAPINIKPLDPNEYQELVVPPSEKKPYMREELSAAQNKVKIDSFILGCINMVCLRPNLSHLMSNLIGAR
jgi:hypothetical protein